MKQIGFDRWVEYVGMGKEQEMQEAMTVAQEAMTVAQQRMAQQLQDSESECACAFYSLFFILLAPLLLMMM